MGIIGWIVLGLLAGIIAKRIFPGGEGLGVVVTTLLGMSFDHNLASRKLCESLGFEQCGHLATIANLDGAIRGLIISALRISEPGSCSPFPFFSSARSTPTLMFNRKMFSLNTKGLPAAVRPQLA
mgnify:CR=1 FL=1